MSLINHFRVFAVTIMPIVILVEISWFWKSIQSIKCFRYAIAHVDDEERDGTTLPAALVRVKQDTESILLTGDSPNAQRGVVLDAVWETICRR